MTNAPHDDASHQIPRARMWIFAGLFLIVAIAMYAGTMYRIQHYGYTGIGQDKLAHPENAPQAQPQN